MDEPIWQRTADAVCTASDSGDLARLQPLLAPDVRWHGAGPGGCHSAEEILAWIGTRTAEGTRFRLCGLTRAGHRLLLHVAVEPGGEEVHQVLTLDDAGHNEVSVVEQPCDSPEAGNRGDQVVRYHRWRLAGRSHLGQG
jgi:hypothetical protein